MHKIYRKTTYMTPCEGHCSGHRQTSFEPLEPWQVETSSSQAMLGPANKLSQMMKENSEGEVKYTLEEMCRQIIGVWLDRGVYFDDDGYQV